MPKESKKEERKPSNWSIEEGPNSSMTQQNKEVRTRGRPSWALDSESEDEDGDSTIGSHCNYVWWFCERGRVGLQWHLLEMGAWAISRSRGWRGREFCVICARKAIFLRGKMEPLIDNFCWHNNDVLKHLWFQYFRPESTTWRWPLNATRQSTNTTCEIPYV